MKDSLFAPAPRRKGRIVLTLTASLLFHGSLIGVAAFWPTRPVPKGPGFTLIEDQPSGLTEDKPVLPPEPLPTEQPAVQPDLKITDPVDAPLPPAEPNLDNMTLSTPKPPAVQRTTSRAISINTAPRTTRSSGAVSSTSNPNNAVAGGSGANSGVRWNKPKPVYPAPQRLARVQGSGVVQVATDATGRVVRAVIVQSTGNAALDDNTCRFARSFWSGPPNAMLSVPITYQLQ